MCPLPPNSRLFAAPFILALLASGTPGNSHAQPGVSADPRNGGIWKAAVPPRSMRGEFGNLDPLGIVSGARIKADCSFNWIDPDTGKRYCFSSGTSLEVFLDSPQANLERARLSWRKMAAERQ